MDVAKTRIFLEIFHLTDTNDSFAANGLQTLLGIEEENLSSNLEVNHLTFFAHSIILSPPSKRKD